MSRFAPVIIPVFVLLAACSKQEQPPAMTASPALAKPSPVGAGLARSSPGTLETKDRASPAPTAQSAPAAAKIDDALLKQGGELFTNNCATCHMADGGGVPNMQPSIIGSGWVSAPDPQLLLSLILRGAKVMGEAANAYDNKMPPLDHLSDAEVAATATYVRQRFASTPINVPVTPAEVAVARARPGLPQ